jgi:hypothetical protein
MAERTLKDLACLKRTLEKDPFQSITNDFLQKKNPTDLAPKNF